MTRVIICSLVLKWALKGLILDPKKAQKVKSRSGPNDINEHSQTLIKDKNFSIIKIQSPIGPFMIHSTLTLVPRHHNKEYRSGQNLACEL